MLDARAVRGRAEALRFMEPKAVLAWAVSAFRGRVALSVSFGGPGVALAHMLSQIDRTVPVVFIDTGLLFAETYVLRRELAARWRLDVVDVRADVDPGPLYETDPDRCCDIRKVQPMQRALAGVDAWISALRRDQGASRARVEVAEYHEADGRPLVKVHPLAYWDRATVWRYLLEHDVPYHPLLDQGYTSLGCRPCTRRTLPGEDERAGRWSGTGKTECGLHTFSARARVAAEATS